ncbi:MAG TPA: DUF4331 family protein [Acidimicrobiales bacterium]
MSDHISGPRALAVPAADITDLYAFASPERPGHLALVLNTLPFAQPSDSFSDGLIYRFRIRPLAALSTGPFVPFALSDDEFVVDFVFAAPTPTGLGGGVVQDGSCRIPSGETVPFRVGVDCEAPGVRVFAGVRWDPFIMDAPAAVKTIETEVLAFRDRSSIFLDGKNVLSIVVELDSARLLGGVEQVAVIGETLTRGKLMVRMERTGRPEVKNLLLAPKPFDPVNQDLEIRDLYNSEDAFCLGETYKGAYRARLNANLRFWDGLDGKADWPDLENGAHPLTELVLADFLAVDLTRPYVEHGSFLEIELAGREGRSHQTCGGRSLNDDVMDTLFTLWVNGGNGPRIRDGVDQASVPATTVFPYLAALNPDPPRRPVLH